MAEESKKSKSVKTVQKSTHVSNRANEGLDIAMNEVKSTSSTYGHKLGATTTAESFKGLPMKELIAAPLIAAAEAQQELARTAWNFYKQIAFDKDNKTRILEFDIQRPIEQNGTMQLMNQKVNAPFLGLVPIPSLLIDNIDVDFQMEVTNTENIKSTTNADIDTKIEGKYWFVSAEISGKVSTSRENTRSTNQTGKYQVHVSASQQPQTEGLSKLMDIMASCIEPIQSK